jgi:hypothetical protein
MIDDFQRIVVSRGRLHSQSPSREHRSSSHRRGCRTCAHEGTGAVKVPLPEISVSLPCPCGRERLGMAQPSAPCATPGRERNLTVLHSVRKAFLGSNFALCPRRSGVLGGEVAFAFYSLPPHRRPRGGQLSPFPAPSLPCQTCSMPLPHSASQL